MTPRRAARLAAVFAGVTMVVPLASIAHAVPVLTNVSRTGPGMNDLTMSWPAVPGTDHYTISIVDGSRETLKPVPASVTNASFPNVLSSCNPAKVQVRAVDAYGNNTPSSVKMLPRVSPGSVKNLATSRANDGKSISMSWEAPADTGLAPVTAYDLEVKQLNTGAVILSRSTMDTSATVSGLSSLRQYSAKITARNQYGTCVTSTVLFRNQTPSEPRNLRGWRDPSNPGLVRVAWDAPAWPGYGPLTEYEVSYRSAGKNKTFYKRVPATSLETTLNLADAERWSLHVRAYNGNGNQRRSVLSKEFWVRRASEPEPIESDPRVTLTQNGGIVTVTFSGPVGSHSRYKNMLVDVAPTGGGAGLRDSQLIANGAANVVFDQVPCGSHTIVITGFGSSGSKEFARLEFNRCA